MHTDPAPQPNPEQNPHGLSPEQLAAMNDAMSAQGQGGWQQHAEAAQRMAAQAASDPAALQAQLQQAQEAQRLGEQHHRPDAPARTAANRAYDEQVAAAEGADWKRQMGAAVRESASNEMSSMVDRLPKWGVPLMLFGALLAAYNIWNARDVIGPLGFFEAYFLVESPIHAFQAYGSLVGLVGGAVLLGAGLAMKNRR